MLKIGLISLVTLLTGCSTMMCAGTGTCHKDAQGNYITDSRYYVENGYTDYRGSTPYSGPYNQAAVITTNSGNYVIVPRASGGSYPSAVIRSGGK